jgi:hypothetical protein
VKVFAMEVSLADWWRLFNRRSATGEIGRGVIPGFENPGYHQRSLRDQNSDHGYLKFKRFSSEVD